MEVGHTIVKQMVGEEGEMAKDLFVVLMEYMVLDGMMQGRGSKPWREGRGGCGRRREEI